MHSTSDDTTAPTARRFDPPDLAAVPGAHLGLSWRALAAGDAADVAALWGRSDAADLPGSPTGRDDIDPVLAAVGTTGDALGGHDAEGVLRAAAAIVLEPYGVGVQVRLRATIDPSHRGRGIGKALLTWQEDRARQLLAEHASDGPARIVVEVDPHQTDRRRLYAAAGLAPVPGDDPGSTFVVNL